MSSGIESTVPLNTRFLIAYNPFKVFEDKSSVIHEFPFVQNIPYDVHVKDVVFLYEKFKILK